MTPSRARDLRRLPRVAPEERPRLRLVKESFDLNVSAKVACRRGSIELHVVVNREVVLLMDPVTLERLAAGTWDAGGYVYYSRSHELCVHPALLDAVDLALRKRMTTPGKKAARVQG